MSLVSLFAYHAPSLTKFCVQVSWGPVSSELKHRKRSGVGNFLIYDLIFSYTGDSVFTDKSDTKYLGRVVLGGTTLPPASF